MPSISPPEITQETVDPNKGFICLTTYLRPKANVTDPNHPNEKFQTAAFIPAMPSDRCLCGSGETFANCCRPKPEWHPICVNPDGMFSLAAPKQAVFDDVDGTAVYEGLMGDSRLHCTSDDPNEGFWIYLGDMPHVSTLGIRCYGDIELRPPQLIITGMTDERMQILLNLMDELFGDALGEPTITNNPIKPITKKRGGKRQRPRKPKRRR